MKTIEAARLGSIFPDHHGKAQDTATVSISFRFRSSLIAGLLAAPILHAQTVTTYLSEPGHRPLVAIVASRGPGR